MSPAQVFGIIVRVVGLGVTMVSIPLTFNAYATRGILFPSSPGLLELGHLQVAYDVNWPLIHRFVLFLVGLWMLRGARSLVAFAYPEEFPRTRPRIGQPHDGQPHDGQPHDGQPHDGQPGDGRPKAEQ